MPDRHSVTEMHRSRDDATGDPITAGYAALADGAGGVVWGAGGGAEVYKRLTDYGAVPDDTTDSTTEIQAAIDACVAGDTLFVDGQFVITATLTWPVNIRLLGYGAAPTWGELPSRIRMTTANTTAISSDVGSPNTAKVVLEGVEIKGPGSAGSGRGVYSTSDVLTRHAIVRGFYDGIHVDDSGAHPTAFYTQIEDSWLDGNARANLYLATKVNNVTIRGCRLSDSAYGVYGSGGIFSGRIEGNAIEAFSAMGLYLDGSGASQSTEAIIIAGNYFEDAGGGGTATADIDLGATNTVYNVTLLENYHNPSGAGSLWHVDLHKTDHVTMIGGFFGVASEAGSIRGHSTNTVRLVLINIGLYAGVISIGASATVLERALITPQSVGVANAAGTSAYLARADHVHDGSGSGSSLTVKDEGTPLATAATSIDFVGPLVTASGAGAAKTITVTGALDDLTDVTIASAATADRLRWNGSAWVNSALIWAPVMVLDPGTGNYLVLTDTSGNAIMAEI